MLRRSLLRKGVIILIVKELSKSNNVLKMEALLRRTPNDYFRYEEMKEDLRKRLAGYNGERAISYYLDYLPDKDYFIFHDMRFPSGNHYFQIDYLVLSPHLALILECKNFYGTLFLEDSFNQLIRTANDKEEGFHNPLAQARWHQQQLSTFFSSHGYSQIPIDYLVAFSSPSTILKTNSRDPSILKKIVHGYNLLERLTEIERVYKNEVMDMKSMRKLSKLLLKSHVPGDQDILQKYGVAKSEVITGVQCPNCKALGMIRVRRKWFCEKCECYDSDAHIDAVKDYFFLLNSTISNKQFREFTHLTSVDMASKLLMRMNLPSSGANKGRVYHPH
ncbi:nuclease-related domain-containing protein [Cytobacillus massiliigabonensis]|uniref:nuclease-related domain-containing protein n=1 Tax=Cytobacillus massiliigabonensis TaxID=1871011 RepID=UPI001F3ACE86|nr:nuclease-related domain-containing protein [Cytobacillus massiliigabonensis]